MNDSGNMQVIIAGHLHRETIINLDGQVFIDLPGGNLAYTSTAYHFWTQGAGLISRVSEDYPEEYIKKFRAIGFDVSGIQRSNLSLESRAFFALINEEDFDNQNPIKYFSKLKIPLPKLLLGYSKSPSSEMDSRNQSTPFTFHPKDIPESYLDASIAYLGGLDYLSMNFLPPHLRNGSVQNIILKPSSGTLNPSFWYEFSELICGSTVIICTKKTILNLFLGRSENLWEIAQTIANCGVDIVVITCGVDGQILLDRKSQKQWEIPAYPVRVVDYIHASDAFAGGFLAGFRLHFDPLIATLYGNVSASIKIQGSGPFYILGALPALAKSRMDILKAKVIER